MNRSQALLLKRHLMKILFCTMVFLGGSLQAANYDVVIYGGTSGGVISAVAAGREGKKVALLEPTAHVGGLTTGGLGAVDFGASHTIGGYTIEYFNRLNKLYGGDHIFAVTPKKGEELFRKMLKDAKVDVFYSSRLKEKDGVVKNGARITELVTEDGRRFSAKVFIDGSYEGDLMAQAGVSYTVGRESTAQYGESAAGVRRFYFFAREKDVLDETGELLPDIVRGEGGKFGEGDNKVQSYNFRLCMTQDKKNFVPVRKPDNYNPKRYQTLSRKILSTPEKAWRFEDFVSMRQLPEDKVDANNKGWISTDLINGSWAYPEGSYAERKKIWDDHISYVWGLVYFLGNDSSLPGDLRRDTLSWGFAKDEFEDTEHFPNQLYVREARRMIGEYVMIQKDVQTQPTKPDSVGMGSYMLDVHWTQKFLASDGKVYIEGLLGPNGLVPYEIPYRSLLPKKQECENLLVPVCISASHVVFSSVRMEPVYMMLGHASGVAAAQAIDENASVQDVNIQKLQKTLKSQKQILGLKNPDILLRKGSLPGVIADDSDARFSGYWVTAANARPYFHDGYRAAPPQKAGAEPSVATFTLRIPQKGKYAVEIFYSPNQNRSTKVPVRVQFKGQEKIYHVDMRAEPKNAFTRIGSDLELDAGDIVTIVLSNEGVKGYIIADAVRLINLGGPEIWLDSKDAIAAAPRAPDLPEPTAGAINNDDVNPEDIILLDDKDAKLEGNWLPSTNGKPFHGTSFRFAESERRSGKISKATYALTAKKAGTYSAQMIFVPHQNRARNAKVSILQDSKSSTYQVDQRRNPNSGFVEFAVVSLKEGEEISIVISNEGSSGMVVADAIRLVPLKTTGGKTATQSPPIEGEVKNDIGALPAPPKVRIAFHDVRNILKNGNTDLFPKNVSAQTLQEVRLCADKMLERILPDHAINNVPSPDSVLIIPYFSNYCSMALVRAYALTKDQRYLDASRNWMRWYVKHIQKDGTVHDYKGGAYPNYKDSGTYDSADSYPTTLAYALWLDYCASRDEAFLREMWPQLQKAMKAVEEVRNRDDLTFAKRDYKIKYFMDNIEVYFGLVSCVKIAGVIDPKNRIVKDYSKWAENCVKALEKYWDKNSGFFYFAQKSLDTKRLYPGALANMFGVIFMLPKDENSATLFNWTKDLFFKTRQIKVEDQTPQLMAWIALASQRAGNSDYAEKIFDIYDNKPNAGNHRTHYFALKLIAITGGFHTPTALF